jgi:hypothetical protein
VRKALCSALGLALAVQPCLGSAAVSPLAAPLSPSAQARALSPAAAALPLSPSAGGSTRTAEALSATAKGLLPLPERPDHIHLAVNNPVEDFFALTLLSLPFTAIWGLLGAVLVGSIAQAHFPPTVGTPLLAGAGVVAAGASVSIALVSIQWGGSSGPRASTATAQGPAVSIPAPSATPIPTPSPRP